MDEKMRKQNEEVKIDLARLLHAILHKAWAVFLVAILCAAIALVGTIAFITPQYQSSTMIYVNNGSLSLGSTSISLSAGDLSVSRALVNTYIVILNTRETLNDVIDYSGVDISYNQLRNSISAAAVDDTEIFRITVTHPDPVSAEKLADAIAYVLPKRIDTIVEGASAKVAETAVMSTTPSSPSHIKNVLIGLLAGVLMSCGVIVITELTNVYVRTEEDIARSCDHPVLATVPDMTSMSGGGRYRRYSYAEQGQPASGSQGEVVGVGISFAATEAYKLLRTKLQYSFADERNSRVIGVSSALTGEGKSITSVNLAHSLSQLDKKVLLIDCDMRRPSLCTKMPINKQPGLSGYLTSQNHLNELIQSCGLKDAENAFQVIASGQNPPNPVELLSSARMERLINKLRDMYDYIILDLPPVTEVSDSLAVAKLTDGMLLVVRQNYCDRRALSATAQQFAFVDGRILGVVYNCAEENANGYGKYYKKYYRRGYGYRYASSYLAASKSAAKGKE